MVEVGHADGDTPRENKSPELARHRGQHRTGSVAANSSKMAVLTAAEKQAA
jgi:hypothetical protein